MSEQQIGFTDRYQALGIPYPNPETVCKGQCEGTGFIPVWHNEEDAELRRLWSEAHNVCLMHPLKRAMLTGNFRSMIQHCDGTHFVKCPTCGGTGLQPVKQVNTDE